MTLIRAKQLDAIVPQPFQVSGTLTATLPSSSLDVTALFTDRTPGGSSTQVGVVTDNAIVSLSSGDGLPFTAGQVELYGRLTHVTNKWRIRVYEKGTNEEVPISLDPPRAIEIVGIEMVQLKNTSPSGLASLLNLQAMQVSTPPTGPFYGNKTQRVVPQDKQTTFTLEAMPVDPTAVDAEVNGVSVRERVQVVGTTATYDPTDYHLDSRDQLVFTYRIAIDLG